MSAFTQDGSDLMLIVLAVAVIGLAVWAVSKLFPVHPTPAKATGRDTTSTQRAADVQENSIKIPTRHYNTLKTIIFLAALTALLVVVGSWLGGTGGMLIAFGLTMVLHGIAYWFFDRPAPHLNRGATYAWGKSPPYSGSRERVMNRIKTAMFLALLTALLLWVGQLLAGQVGLIVALVFAGLMNFGAYWWSDKLVLRMYGAQEVQEAEAPELVAIVRDLARRGRMPMPKVYVIPQDAPNAFATGRNPQRAAVAVTEGLMRLLDREELAGVIAHELGHVRNRDTLIMTVVATIAGALSMLANTAMWGMLLGGGQSSDEEEGGNPLVGLLGILIAPIAAALIQMAISRSREFLADEAGARLSGNPLALARALHKIEAWSQVTPLYAGSPATAHLFIINPFTGGGLVRLFSTHPSTQERIERLEAMARQWVAYRA
jgi:heat shock protein HtpX